MRLTPRDEEVLAEVRFEVRISIQAAAYSTYIGLTPGNKKPLSPREFHQVFADNWPTFATLENEHDEG